MARVDETKLKPTLTILETSTIWVRDNKLTLTLDVDLDRDGNRQFIAMLRPWKQDKEHPYMWWYCHEVQEEAVLGVIDKCCQKGKHQDLDFGYRPWNLAGGSGGSIRTSPFSR